MIRTAVVLALAAALAGCQSPAKSSGITTVSPGIFAVSQLSVPSFYEMGMLRAWARGDAVAYCTSLKKTMRVVDEKQAEPPPGSNDYRRFDLTFACDQA